MATITFSEHPEYKKFAPKWIKWRDLYDGDHDVLRSPAYLLMHDLEYEKSALLQQQNMQGVPIGQYGALPTGTANKLRFMREQRSRYLNLTEPVVSRWLSFLFRNEPIVPDAVKAIFEGNEYNDVTGDGVGFESFIRDHVGKNYIQFGKPVIYVDTSGAYARTLAEAKAVGSRPFMEVLNPLEVVDWQITSDPARKGNFDWLRTEFDLLEPRNGPGEAPKMRRYSKVLALVDGVYTITIYRERGDQSVKTNTIDWEMVGSPVVIPDWNEIPISYLCGESFIKDVAEQQLHLFNVMSAHASMLNDQAYQRIFISGVNNENAKMLIGEFVINYIPEGATVQTVEPAPTAALENEITATIDQLFKVAFNQINSIHSDSKVGASAETRREMREEFVAMVKTTLEELEDIINEAVGYYAKFKGKTLGEKDRVVLDKNITSEDVENELLIYQAHMDDFNKVQSLRKGILKKHAKFFNLPNQDQVDTDIDSTDFAAVDKQAAQMNIKANLQQQVLGNGNPGIPQPKPAA